MNPPSDDLPESILLALGAAVKPAELSQEQRDRMRLRVLDEARHAAPEGTTTRRAAESPWIAIAPKVQVRQLARDHLSRTHMSLLRMLPGGIIPAHRHELEETFVVLEGDCHIGHHYLGTGDAHTAAAGSWHEAVTTQAGVLVLLKGEFPYPSGARP